MLWFTMTYQIYERVPAVYDKWMGEWGEPVNKSYIAGKSEFMWYFTLTLCEFYPLY